MLKLVLIIFFIYLGSKVLKYLLLSYVRKNTQRFQENLQKREETTRQKQSAVEAEYRVIKD